MNLLLIIPLVLLHTNTGWAHSLARIEDARIEVNTTQPQDVYEVKDGSSSIQFVYPEQKQPTLREITYYHVIERPYDEKTVLHEEAPYSDVNVRQFTNSHAGFQFLGPELDKEPTQDIPESLEIPDEDLAYEEFIKVPDIKVGTTTTEEPEYEIVYIDEVENDGTDATTEMTAYSVTDVDENLKNGDNHTTELTEQSENMPIETEPAKRSRNLLFDQAKEKYINRHNEQAKRARNLLFDRVKEKYSTKHNERENTSTVALKRRKRDLTGEIPEAPKLEDLDLDSLPPHIRNMIAVGQNYFKTQNEKDKELSEIRQKIRGVFDKLDDTKETTGVPTSKTYGMRLDGENGYVWNDMSKPGVYYEIEPPNDKLEQESKEKEATNQQDQKDDKQHIEQNKTEEISEGSNEFENDKDNSREQNTETKDVEDEKKTEMSKSGELRKQKKEKEDPIKDLIENEQFWKWLEEWTAVYMEELTKYFTKQIKGEVKKQMKMFVQSQKDNKEKKKTPEQSEKGNEDEFNKGNADTNKKSENPNDLVKEDTKDKIETPLEETTEASVHDDSKNQEKNDEETKTEIDAEKVDKNNTTPVSINAKNMYGSSIGSDKVTNFFIFYPSNEIKDILTEVKPANNSEPGIFIIGTPKEDKKEGNKTDKETSTPFTDKRINKDLETTTVSADKTTPSTETPVENKIDENTTATVESTTESKKEEKELEKETDIKEESSDDKKEDAKSSEKDDANKEDKKEENDETSKENEVKDDSETAKVKEKSEEKV